MEFKQLKTKPESGYFKRIFGSRTTGRSLLFVAIGALSGFLYYYFTEGKYLDILPTIDILKSLAIGGFFGFFITNSPCARNRC